MTLAKLKAVGVERKAYIHSLIVRQSIRKILGSIKLSELRQSEKNKHHMISLIQGI